MWPFRRSSPEQIAANKQREIDEARQGVHDSEVATRLKQLEKAIDRTMSELKRKKYPVPAHRQKYSEIERDEKFLLAWQLYEGKHSVVECKHAPNCACSGNAECAHKQRGGCDCPVKFQRRIYLLSNKLLVWTIGNDAIPTHEEFDADTLFTEPLVDTDEAYEVYTRMHQSLLGLQEIPARH